MTWLCTECGSADVYADAYIGVNDPELILGPYDNYFCARCEQECRIAEHEPKQHNPRQVVIDEFIAWATKEELETISETYFNIYRVEI